MSNSFDGVALEKFYPSEIVRLESLKEWPRNYNEHDSNQVELLGNSLSDFGQFKNVVVWRNPADGIDYIVAGTGVTFGAKAQGWEEIEVKRLPSDKFTALDIEAVLVADNRLSTLGTPNMMRLSEILHDIKSRSPNMLESTGFSMYDVERLQQSLQEMLAPQSPFTPSTEPHSSNKRIEEDDVAKAAKQLKDKYGNNVALSDKVQMFCPGCGEEFFVKKEDLNFE